MRIKSVWCVTNPHGSSDRLEDIVWKTTPRRMQLWAKGGEVDDSLTWYMWYAEARRDGLARLKRFAKVNAKV